MRPTVTIDTSEFQRALRRHLATTSRELSEAVNMRLAALELLLSHYSSSVGAFRPLLLHIKTRAQKDACSLQMVAVTGFEPVTPRV